MNNSERLLATFRKEKIDRPVWQPRLEHWFAVNHARNTLPSEYESKKVEVKRGANIAPLTESPAYLLRDIYDDLNASIRYPPIGSSLLKIKYETVKIKTEIDKEEMIKIYSTPKGNLKEKRRFTEYGCSSQSVEYPVKSLNDIPIMEYILMDKKVKFDKDAYRKKRKYLDNRGLVQFILPRSPLQRVMLNFMGMQKFLINLKKNEEAMQRLFHTVKQSDDPIYEKIKKSPLKIVNFGENIDGTVTPPYIFEKYCLPYYEKRVKDLKKSGKFTHIHMDGLLKPLLPLLKKLPFDGIEAATPKPQGDVSLKELKNAIGDKILLDGIPAISFLPWYPIKNFERIVQKIIKYFSPNLILGVSDELPPDSEINRLKIVSKMLKNIKK